ncbi:hypothetical protein BGZ94_001838 [Podila epigama]|nr:hypothetical protein BGZ94_001838 [Podila epigama]
MLDYAACHKVNPSGGAGALNAMHDAVALGNWLSTLEAPVPVESLDVIFSEYVKERMPLVQEAFLVSGILKDLGGKCLNGCHDGYGES